MITSTIPGKASRRAFTLPEVIIASTLGTIVLAGVISTFLMLGRSGASIANYSTMEMQSRRAIEELAQDLRMAKDVTWNSSTSITLLIDDNYAASGNEVTYAYDNAAKTFYRKPGKASSSNDQTVLIANVPECEFKRFDRLDNPTTWGSDTKRIQLEIKVNTKTVTVADTSNNVISASFILRNKLTY